MNLSLNAAISQGFLELTTIVPIFKKGDQHDRNGYRAISALSNINKLMEKLLYIRLYQFLNQNKCLHNDHFPIRNALDNDRYVCCKFLDFRKIFDTVNHKILLFKLEHYRVRRMPFKFFQT